MCANPSGAMDACWSICPSRLLKKTHMLSLRSIASLQRTAKYASARRFFARRSAELGRSLASEIFLTNLQTAFFNNLLGVCDE